MATAKKISREDYLRMLEDENKRKELLTSVSRGGGKTGKPLKVEKPVKDEEKARKIWSQLFS